MKKINFTIKLKLIVYAASIVLTMTLLGFIFKSTLNKMSLNKSIADEFKSVWIKTLEIRKSEKDFLFRENTNMKFFETGESKYATEIDNSIKEANTLLNELKETEIVKENNINIAAINDLFAEYHTNFKKIVEAKLKRGELDFGLVGEMRNAIKAVEEEVLDNQTVSLQVLTLRRYEKDYLLRRDKKYIEQHSELVKTMLESAIIAPSMKDKLISYQKALNAILEIDAIIGFTPQEGLEGNIRAVVHKVEPAIDEITKTLNEVLESDNNKSVLTLLVLITLGISISVIVSFYIIKSISSSLKHAVDTIGRIADGDLNFEVKSDNKDEIGQLLNKMGGMTSRLKDIISSIRAASLNIAAASSQMNASAQQMSEGATEQASSVEEISSSMEEMTANIQQNTNNSKQTEKIAREAAKDVLESNKAVGKTVDSMKTIAAKISIIGEISRQTNLLALNAAVEAARAGEHGKGFAVVAAEVRKLAERSQSAATEINEVSSVSVDIAQKSGELLNSVVPNIQKTSDLVQEISASSTEQNSGANQVNNAIQQLNQVVQENAATAEEMAAGAEELSTQADSLKEIIAFFKTGDDETGNTKQKHNVKRTMSAKLTSNNLTPSHKNQVKTKSGGGVINIEQTEAFEDQYVKY
ncbi:MAG: HAMP domain-containing methyl-accepting chemotaxis protein [Bacteroidota bacterium]